MFLVLDVGQAGNNARVLDPLPGTASFMSADSTAYPRQNSSTVRNLQILCWLKLSVSLQTVYCFLSVPESHAG
jgi:hypothetical protein